ncbi:hypothetical protein AMATHDRAFT_156161, partial [Amanita thiersii Skay4041]
LTAFFVQYNSPTFTYNPNAPPTTEFARLVRHSQWGTDPHPPTYYEAHERFSRAMGLTFRDFYGSDIHDINAWQALCLALGVVDPVPDTLRECKRIVKSTHVNLVDLIETRRTGELVRIFESQAALRNYTRRHKKIFPKESAKESGVLKYLLRRIF